METRSNHRLDFRGSISSIALLELTRRFNEMKPGECMEILGSDPDMRQDLFKVLPDTAYEVISINEGEGEAYFFRVRLRKRSTDG